jgi:SAM-dependent methyltransferase
MRAISPTRWRSSPRCRAEARVDHAGKVAFLTGGRDLAQCRGLEIGPRDAPLVRRDMGPVLYVDYADTETVKENYHGFGADPSRVEAVDIVTGGGSLVAVLLARVDYIVASHVVEHVPDLLGWLADMHGALRDGGTLGLAIPDRRFTFDRFRRESSIAEAVEAYLLQWERPSLRQVFDSAWMSVDIGVAEAWRNELPEKGSAAHRAERLKPALELVRRIHANANYNDAHCWVFTPASFLELLDQAARMDLLPFTVQDFHPTEQGGYEFYVVLRQGGGDVAGSIAAARDRLACWPAERVFAAAHVAPEIAALRAENAALRESLDGMRRSRFWRATAPARALIDRLRT